MTAEAFRAWQKHMRLNTLEVSQALGKSRHTIMRYRESGVPERDSRLIRLALRAIANAHQPWPETLIVE